MAENNQENAAPQENLPSPEGSGDSAEPEQNAPSNKTELTVPEMRQWLRNWVGKAVGQSPDGIDESVPM
ncbi:MAG: hypothetical protein WBZ37_13310, partial [Mycobacterium sp.]